MLDALAAKKIIASTLDTDNAVREIEAALWLGREFADEVRQGRRCPVVAIAAGKKPLRDILFKRDEVLREWPPENGRKRGRRIGRPSDKDIVCDMAVEMLDSGEVQPKHGVKIEIANRIRERGSRYEPNTIAGYISQTVDDWIAKSKGP